MWNRLISRRNFLKRGVFFGVVGGLSFEGFVFEPRQVEVTNTSIYINGLPMSLTASGYASLLISIMALI